MLEPPITFIQRLPEDSLGAFNVLGPMTHARLDAAAGLGTPAARRTSHVSRLIFSPDRVCRIAGCPSCVHSHTRPHQATPHSRIPLPLPLRLYKPQGGFTSGSSRLLRLPPLVRLSLALGAIEVSCGS